MYQILRDLIGYSGSYNYDQYVLYGCIAVVVLFLVVIFDWLLKLLSRFIPRG